MSGLNLVSLFGWAALAAMAWALGGFSRRVAWRTIVGAGLLMWVMGVVVFLVRQTRGALWWINRVVVSVLEAGNAGAAFLFGPLAAPRGGTTAAGEPSVGFVLAAQVLPAVVFFASLMAALYHMRLIQPLIRLFARLFRKSLQLSGAEALAGSSNIFFGVEATTTVRPFLARMTRSELLTVLTCGMSTVASTTLAIYVFMLKDVFENIAGHLISASVLSIPAAALTSKLMLPETEEPETFGRLPEMDETDKHGNVISALSAGAWDGLRLAAGIAALLIAVLGAVAILDLLLVSVTRPLGHPIDFNLLLSWAFTPVAWLLGIERADMAEAGRLLGGRLVLTEVFAYQELASLARDGAISSRTMLVLSYALCGFTHVASMGIFVGGAAALAPSRRDDLTGLGPRALVGATLATLMTGALAGALYHGQRGLLG